MRCRNESCTDDVVSMSSIFCFTSEVTACDSPLYLSAIVIR